MAESAPLVPILGAEGWQTDWKIVSLHDCQEPDFSVESENTVLIALLIRIRHYTEGAAYQNQGNKPPTNGSMIMPAKIQRTHFRSKGANYDRIFTFIDLKSTGRCFNIISQTPTESDILMKYGKESSSVGDMFLILEPDRPTSSMQNVLSLTTAKSFVPVEWNPTILPSVSVIPPAKGQQRYFVLKEHKVGISKINVVTASCSGILCDRRNPPSRNIGCGCLHMARAADLVFEMHVTIYTKDERDQDIVYYVLGFRSHRTSSLFLKPVGLASDLVAFFRQEKQIRATAKKITGIINHNGGWTIVGWYRKGEVEDASAPTNETGAEIEGVNKPIHIAYLYPSLPTKEWMPLVEEHRFDVSEDTSNTSNTNNDTPQAGGHRPTS